MRDDHAICKYLTSVLLKWNDFMLHFVIRGTNQLFQDNEI